MIKLKNIIKESKKELHTVTTMKDDNPFMTEDQFNKKWDKKSEIKEGMAETALIARLAMAGLWLIIGIIAAWTKRNPGKAGQFAKSVSKIVPPGYDQAIKKEVMKKHKLKKK